MPTLIKKTARLMGFKLAYARPRETLIAATGGIVGIAAVAASTIALVPPDSVMPVVASMGASAVLLFAVPHGPLSQPWPLIGGHVISALVGVSCARYIGNPVLAAALSVGLAIGLMHALNCIHPPGGATALTAVLASPALLETGYAYVWSPVMANTLVILVVAVIYHALVPTTHYPAALMAPTESPDMSDISEEDFDYAIQQMDAFVDVSEEELASIYRLARRHARGMPMRPENIRSGICYTNGHFGSHWSVRQVIETSAAQEEGGDEVVYKVVAGQGRRESGQCTRAEFAKWARHAVVREDSTWRRIEIKD